MSKSRFFFILFFLSIQLGFSETERFHNYEYRYGSSRNLGYTRGYVTSLKRYAYTDEDGGYQVEYPEDGYVEKAYNTSNIYVATSDYIKIKVAEEGDSSFDDYKLESSAKYGSTQFFSSPKNLSNFSGSKRIQFASNGSASGVNIYSTLYRKVVTSEFWFKDPLGNDHYHNVTTWPKANANTSGYSFYKDKQGPTRPDLSVSSDVDGKYYAIGGSATDSASLIYLCDKILSGIKCELNSSDSNSYNQYGVGVENYYKSSIPIPILGSQTPIGKEPIFGLGTHYVYAKDKFGNKGSVRTIFVRSETGKPVVNDINISGYSISDPDTNKEGDETYSCNVSFTYSDDISGVKDTFCVPSSGEASLISQTKTEAVYSISGLELGTSFFADVFVEDHNRNQSDHKCSEKIKLPIPYDQSRLSSETGQTGFFFKNSVGEDFSTKFKKDDYTLRLDTKIKSVPDFNSIKPIESLTLRNSVKSWTSNTNSAGDVYFNDGNLNYDSLFGNTNHNEKSAFSLISNYQGEDQTITRSIELTKPRNRYLANQNRILFTIRNISGNFSYSGEERGRMENIKFFSDEYENSSSNKKLDIFAVEAYDKDYPLNNLNSQIDRIGPGQTYYTNDFPIVNKDDNGNEVIKKDKDGDRVKLFTAREGNINETGFVNGREIYFYAEESSYQKFSYLYDIRVVCDNEIKINSQAFGVKVLDGKGKEARSDSPNTQTKNGKLHIITYESLAADDASDTVDHGYESLELQVGTGQAVPSYTKGNRFIDYVDSYKDQNHKIYMASEIDFKAPISRNINLNYNKNDVDKTFYVNIGVYDRAQNWYRTSIPVFWDSRSPSRIDQHDKIITVGGTFGATYGYTHDSDNSVYEINVDLNSGHAFGPDHKTIWPSGKKNDPENYELHQYDINLNCSDPDYNPVFILDKSKTKNEIRIPLDSDYRSNDLIKLNMIITDFAGNSTDTFTKVYTPVKLTGEVNDHLSVSGNEWDNDIGHLFEWNADKILGNPDGDYKSLKLRFNGEYVNPGDMNSIHSGDYVDLDGQRFATNDDQDLRPHGIYEFRLHGVNGSDWFDAESKVENSYIDFSRTVRNNIPVFTHFSLPKSYDCKSEDDPDGEVIKYAGPGDYISFNASDNDISDSFEYFIYVNNTPVKFTEGLDPDSEIPEFSIKKASTEINTQIFFSSIVSASDEKVFENGKEYTIKLEVIDHWGDEDLYSFGNEKESECNPNDHKSVFSQTITFIYDDKTPVINFSEGNTFIYASDFSNAKMTDDQGVGRPWSFIETKNGYSYANGNFYIVLSDELSGVSDPSLRGSNPALAGDDLNGLRAWVNENEELVCTRLEGSNGYLYRIESPPEGTDYTIELQFIDNVGNKFEQSAEINQGRLSNLTEIFHDDTPPEIVSVDLIDNKGTVDDSYLYSTPSVPVNLEWMDNESGVNTVFYRYLLDDEVIDEGSVASYEGFFEASRSDIWKINCPLNTVPVEGQRYTLEFNIEDFAGNNNEVWVSVSSPVVFDLTPPRIVLDKILGVKYSDTGDWVNELSAFKLEYSILDFDDSSESWYRLSLDSEIIKESSDWLDILSAMENGNSYSVFVCANDKAGHLGISRPVTFMLDTEAPEHSNVVFNLLNDQASWAMGEEVRFRISATDDESGMKGFKLGIGDASNMIPVVTSKITGHGNDGFLHYDYSDSEVYSFNIPVESANGFYACFLSLEDQAGNWSEPTALSGKTIRITHPKEIVVPYDYAPFISFSNQLTGGWNYYGPKEVSHYTYRVVDENKVPMTNWLTTRNNAEMVQLEDPFAHGDQYLFEVKCHLKDGSIIGSRFSNGVFIDQVAPELADFNLHPFASAEGMKLSFDIAEEDSGIGENLLILEMFEKDSDGEVIYDEVEKEGVISNLPRKKVVDTLVLKPEMNFSSTLVKSMVLEELNDNEKLLVSLRVSDNAENVSEFYLGAVVVDNSIPERPLIQDAGDFVNPLKNDSIRFNWEWSKEDEHSGWAESYYQFLKQGGIISETSWLKADDKEAVLDDYSGFSHGDIIICAVKVVNHAGLESIGFSNGIMVDDTKPMIPEVTISGTSGSGKYITSKRLQVRLESVDPESGIIGYSLERGEFKNTDWNELEKVSDFIEGSYALADAVLPDDIENGTLVYFSGTGTNGAFLKSVTGYSDGVFYETRQPEINGVVAGLNRTNLTAVWNIDEIGVPIREIKVDLLRSGVEVESVQMAGDSRQMKLMDLADGYYQLRLVCINEAGISSDPVLSRGILIDNTSPEMQRFEYDYFVSSKVDFVMGAKDTLSGVDAYRYRIGKMGDPDLFTGDWITDYSYAGEIYKHLIFNDDFVGGSVGVIHNEFIVIEVQARDRARNWCSVDSSEPILIDLTPPDTVKITPNRIYFIDGKRLETEKPYITQIKRILNMSFAGSDADSGIKAYSWAITDNPNISDQEIDWMNPVYINRNIKKAQMDIDGLELTHSKVFEDKKQYYVLLKLCNGSGLYSDKVLSVPLIADLSAPVVSTSLLPDLYTGVEDDDSYVKRIVLNDPDSIFYNVDEEIGEHIQVKYTLYNPTSAREVSLVKWLKTENYESFDIDFTPLDKTNYGIYLLKAEFVDIGNRMSSISQPVRLNEPPFISQEIRFTTPGCPLIINDRGDSGELKSTDDFDEIEIMKYTISRNGFESINSGDISQESDWSIKLFHSEKWVQKTPYKLQIEAYDSYGKKATVERDIFVVNTNEGLLYTDEYWKDTHSITGKVVVPAGITLHVQDESTIVAMANNWYGYGQEIYIAQGAELKHYGSATYRLGTVASEKAGEMDLLATWAGLKIDGRANFQNITVERARRGIALGGTTSGPIKECIFDHNYIGLHLYNSSPPVTECIFSDNRYYGVKEDGTATPVFTKNIFIRNGIDYYDTNLTETLLDELNQLGTNSGNKGGEE